MKKYCTYLTIYDGDKLPRRYIGSCKIYNIENKGYNGSVHSKKWGIIYANEQKYNKHLFKTRILTTHNTDFEAREMELHLHKKYNVVKSKQYMNEGEAKPNGFHGRDVSGCNNPMYGKIGSDNPNYGKKHSDEWNNNMSDSRKKFLSSDKGKEWMDIMSSKLSGINNPMYGKTHSNDVKKKMSLKNRGEGNPMYGKTHNETARRKISEYAKTRTSNPMDGKFLAIDKEGNRMVVCINDPRVLSGDLVSYNKGIPKSEETKEKMRKLVSVNDGEFIISNIKQFCKENNYSYILFTQAAKNNKSYKGLKLKYC